ncbi:hypothetical protein E4U41_001948 [Claviceps citrina]|nr:hypothetical protein E4U41_001948 [Claviceps citrina]
MPRKTSRSSAKTPPTRRQTTQLGELDTTPTRPDASPSLPTRRKPLNGGNEHTDPENIDSEGFEDGLEDGDLVQLADTQAIPNATLAKGISWSETGSGARRSSSVSSEGLSKSPFGYLGVGNVFSSPVSGSDALPDTVPLPMDLIQDPLLGDQRQAPMIVDFSETATTVIRSSPMTESRLSKSLGTSSHRDFVDKVWIDDGVCPTPSQPALVYNIKSDAGQIGRPIHVSVEKVDKTFVPDDSARATDVDVDDVRSATKRSISHRSTAYDLETRFVSLDGAADRLDHEDRPASQTAHGASDGKKKKRKRKQRPKSPLRFDNDTQEVKEVFKKPVRKRTCRKSTRKNIKLSPLPSKGINREDEVAESSPRNVSVKRPDRLVTTRCQSSPIEMKATTHKDVPKLLSQSPVKDMEDTMHEAPAHVSSDPEEAAVMDHSEYLEAESRIESPTSSNVRTQSSENGSPRTPPTTSTEAQGDGQPRIIVPATKETIRGENLTASLQTGNKKNDNYSTQKQVTGAEAHSPAQQHNIPSLSKLAHVDTLRSVHDRNSNSFSANKTSDGGKLHLAAARPNRNISVSGQGSPIRVSHCRNNAVIDPVSAEVPTSEFWSGVGHTGGPKRPELSATQLESTQSNNITKLESNVALAFTTGPSTTESTFVREDHAGLRQSILSELKNEHVNRRIVNGYTRTQATDAADQGRQRLHELVDVSEKTPQNSKALSCLTNVPKSCMQHLDSKRKCIIQIADTYIKAGNHCVERIQSRFERERSAVSRLATENTANFFRATSDGKRSVERKSARKSRLMKQFKQAVAARAASYDHASSALDTLHDALLT